ncbi:transcriptional regulator (plasmid) [Haloferax mediterranei ATCC 33500]|uniref:HTH DNA-binding protein n=1 Tax=Haloferax mediterranei (strain ATCC 33500 / DSM 1411 / JCM 8866 / NBRC 14739 / NCIMB 2177 / R-4) TaxID=523841 RepID=I3RAP5_HALMT|nr:helix-turn-helix domain-containing protein [Haloferax mediterranei]AFK21305.1 HTH DNA-binding protein [Haloferax mediterranei ATCC 33500]AHZ24601.1 transcriptional regulator [Haloferax mediterranei ATCC 33500]ELZ97364.1 HTH DNA-binding protein [Haloferax mediterranei ATCC 33500]MDX5990340.1 helix-turn-helix domain-containing protein [Haloferax mediterranei ATCC 33500]QCQ76998.1 transcriptional regulator [Haloferax mediterranei ATCC 33500]
MYKAVFRIESDDPYSSSTAKNNTTIELWCNDHCDLLHITGERQDEVVKHVDSEVGVQERIDNESDQTIITEACLKRHGSDYIEPYLAANNCLLLPPLRYEHGAKVVRVLSLDSSNLTTFYSDISADHTVTVESKKELKNVRSETPVLSVDSFLPTLSDRQREVFLTAYEQGYYEIPRGTTTAELADAVGVGRRTVEHHLRRAEEKFADVFAAYL